MASNEYPDGSMNENWTRLKVVLPKRDVDSAYKVQRRDIISVLCHRVSDEGHEEYLVEWERTTQLSNHKPVPPPYSWHNLAELSNCLALVQEYLASFANQTQLLVPLNGQSRKRRNEDDDQGSSRTARVHAINGVLKRKNGIITIQPAPSVLWTDIVIPTPEMLSQAAKTDTRQAQFDIRIAFDRKLNSLAAPLEIINQFDGTRPPLDFEFISTYIHGKDVVPTPAATIIGCGEQKVATGPNSNGKIRCGPHMGQNIGCEYSRVCECLEFAGLDEKRLSPAEHNEVRRLAKLNEPPPPGLPKRFPYHQSGTLQSFYLDSRHPIYECNPNCRCGPNCKTRLVQKGRTIPLQIFKTRKCNWGLRSTVNIPRGTFIDTYRGEIITNAEAEQREKTAVSGLKASYLYSLDKHVGENGLTAEQCYVVDGEYTGGPTRFINHSCDPNVRQYTVSYNKYDTMIYDLAFFAYKDIRAFEELTFDYLDKDDDDEDEEKQEPESSQNAMRCFCGSRNCRGTLWM